ncbi:Aegerolysin family protein [Endogone sp. FLAS-F59071]|nr:Aegerolysin family protein [Endogone sp. FLAS-F59071]|eukprot:RUS21546.1 Aegerolysin family protein [Endogone sp. FLAS-F59071]
MSSNFRLWRLFTPKLTEFPIPTQITSIIMGFADWVVLIIYNQLETKSIQIKNAKLEYGKFYSEGDKDNNLELEQINSIVIAPKSNVTISSCGKYFAPTGAEGSIDLNDGATKIATLYWDCPHNSTTNDFQVRNSNQNYVVGVGPWNKVDGALGSINITVVEV